MQYEKTRFDMLVWGFENNAIWKIKLMDVQVKIANWDQNSLSKISYMFTLHNMKYNTHLIWQTVMGNDRSNKMILLTILGYRSHWHDKLCANVWYLDTSLYLIRNFNGKWYSWYGYKYAEKSTMAVKFKI